MNLGWTQVAGPCHLDSPSPWKGCSISDWQQSGITCFVESWRTGAAPAERDEAWGSRHLAPGSAPEVVRSVVRAGKPKAKTRAARNSATLKERKVASVSAGKVIVDHEGLDARVKGAGGAAEASNALAMGLPVLLPEEHEHEHVEPSSSVKTATRPGMLSPSPESAVNSAFEGDISTAGKAADVKGAKIPSVDESGVVKFDFVVVGSGIAGLRFALDVAGAGTVAVVTKSERQEGSTQYAQGGVSAVLDPRDSVENHIRDTIVAGAYLNDEEVVEVVCREGPDRVRELMAMGASFDRAEDGRLQLAREGGHSHHRIVHAADVTGREIERALLVAAQKNPNIVLFEHHFVVDLLTSQDETGQSTCHGVDALDVRTGKVLRFLGSSTLLASGGAGQVYPNTTNPPVATGDGVALAHRARAVISNMEFVQFHPTALADAGVPQPPATPRPNAFLITEAVRGAGGVLYNQAGERFMAEYDSRGELAPRDVVARSIDDQLKKLGEQFVWLDISHRPEEEILSHFPNIAEECKRCGIDITKEPIPVVPAAHYMCGGVQTGLHGETSILGLWAAGEVACTGLHGANRLASNSLLEALVFAQRAVGPAVEHALRLQNHAVPPKHTNSSGTRDTHEGKEMAGEACSLLDPMPRPHGVAEADARAVQAAGVTRKYRKQLQAVMWDYVGIVRSTERLLVAERELFGIAKKWKKDLTASASLPEGAVTVAVCEMRNLLAVAVLIVQSALRRQESRGLHFTTDFPDSLEAERLPTVLSPGSVAPLWVPSPRAEHKQAVPKRNSQKRGLAGVRVQATPCKPASAAIPKLGNGKGCLPE